MAVTVLVVDDSEDFRERAAALLRDTPGVEPVGAVCCACAAEAFVEKTPPELVLLDLEMPGRSGFAALQRILERPRPPRVVIVTLHSDEERRSLALSMGASAFVAKSELAEALPGLLAALFPGGRA